MLGSRGLEKPRWPLATTPDSRAMGPGGRDGTGRLEPPSGTERVCCSDVRAMPCNKLVNSRLHSVIMVNESGGGSRDIQSLHRAFDILEAIAHEGDLGVTQIARITSLPVSTVHNLLRTMANRNYVVGTKGRYTLGPAMTILTSQWDPVGSLSRVVQDYVEHVINDTGQTAFASMLIGGHARVIAYKRGHGLITVNENHEDNADPLSIATGRLLVALSGEDVKERFIGVTTKTGHGWSKDQWRVELQTIAQTGVSVRLLPDGDPHACVIAVPVWGKGGQVVCSIAFGAALYMMTAEMIDRAVSSLWQASESLSTKFGCPTLPLPMPRLEDHGLTELVARAPSS